MNSPRRLLASAGAVILVAALVWTVLVVPRMERLPGGIDDTMHYQGTVSLGLDPTTGAPLATPLSVPLTIERRVQAVAGQTGGHRELVTDTVAATIVGRTSSQAWTYLLDRRSMANVPDTRTVVDKAGTYSINLPFNATPTRTYQMWKPETGTSYPLTQSQGAAATKVDGLRVLRLSGGLPKTPVTADEQQALGAQGFPAQLTSEQVTARLAAAGIDLMKTGAALQQALTPAQLDEVLVALTKPLPLQYSLTSSGNALVEPRSGMIVSVEGVTETLTVRPDLSGAAPVLGLLQQHTDIPQIASALAALSAMASAPDQVVYTARYSQTPASVSERVGAAKSARRDLRNLSAVIPLSLGGIALILFVTAAYLRPKTQPPAGVESEDEDETADHEAA
ncbi:MAG TPA: porin PorA family protein [Acidimicrobiales bacterium]|nr:porin PorA family protein [Acidimicrobiales bacterium]